MIPNPIVSVANTIITITLVFVHLSINVVFLRVVAAVQERALHASVPLLQPEREKYILYIDVVIFFILKMYAKQSN